MDARELARQVIRVLDLQRTYFKTRDQDDLRASKRAEAELRATCDGLLNPAKAPPPTLPGMGPEPLPDGLACVPGSGCCVVPGCGLVIPADYLMCGRHWRRVSPALQSRLYDVLARYEAGEGELAELRATQAQCVRDLERP